MKNKDIEPSKLLVLSAIIFVGFLFFGASTTQAQINKLVGDWELSKTDDSNDARQISFKMNGSTITGSYTNAAGEKSQITAISLSGATYSFKIGSLKMSVSLKRENDNLFKGKVRISGEKLHYNVQMVRKQ